MNIYLYLYRNSNGFIRAKKRVWSPRTPQASCFLYSYKTKKYHETFLYYFDEFGEPVSPFLIDSDIFRAALQREGLDLR